MTRYLFVHPNFPAQFGPLAAALATRGDEVVALGRRPAWPGPEGVRVLSCGPSRTAASGDGLVDEIAQRVHNATAVAARCRLLASDGFTPDVIVAHPGWGDALYLRDVFPAARLVCYGEYYYLREGGDLGFDPEFPTHSPEALHRLRGRNAVLLAALDDATLCVAPTRWQLSTHPKPLQSKFAVIHEGVDVEALVPARARPAYLARAGRWLEPGDPVLTYAARHLEPHRGFHVFMRALPALLAREPDLQVVIIGADTPGYGPPPADAPSWLARMRAELGENLDARRVHAVGPLDEAAYRDLMRLSRVHAYLTYPFVLSWSALEAAALGLAMAVSATPPVLEFLDARNAAPVDFFDVAGWTETIAALLGDADRRRRLGAAARESVFDHRLTRADSLRAWLALLDGL